MSAQFGRWNFDRAPVTPEFAQKGREILAPYGPDGVYEFSASGFSMLYFSFHTTKESHREIQPFPLPSGAVLTWDGRLDNRSELISELPGSLCPSSTDVAIVAAAYERWGTQAFRKLIGDWALCLWKPRERSLILAKDPIGARPLYYAFDGTHLLWSTILDPLILMAENTFAIEEEYLAAWLSLFPAAHLTPYRGIRSVPPSCFVRLRDRKAEIHEYWNFDAGKKIRYATDAQYEEHFRAVFAEAVRRRLRSTSPVLAELSGGMDSSSIVCMADEVVARSQADTPSLDTVSYYDNSEPAWNEKPYFTAVEARRGRAGFHIEVSARNTLRLDRTSDSLSPLPASSLCLTESMIQFKRCLKSRGHRVVLSGIGGDEALGGVPTPAPELADLAVNAHPGRLLRQMVTWALATRRPLFELAIDTARNFLPVGLARTPPNRRVPAWINPSFMARNRTALEGYPARLKISTAALPSFQENVAALALLRRQLASTAPPVDPVFEKRYPYLDRDLLEFVYAIPREQILRPHQRRSLMRRALTGIVPDLILERKRKAFVARAPIDALNEQWPTLLEIAKGMMSENFGIVDSKEFLKALVRAREGHEVPIVAVLRTFQVEHWLRNLYAAGRLSPARSLPRIPHPLLARSEMRMG
jgi:asparagine synthase (glutamine-hydrolysing)